ncbi:MAG: glycosyltransferase family 1 protein [Thermoanaerobaculia bacterium]
MTRPKILWDARKARDFGIGTYVVGLLSALAASDTFELTALVRPADEELFPPSVRTISSHARHYSLGELVSVRLAIARLTPDLFHAPHYVVPLFPPGRTVVTIHDLMHLTRPEHASLAKRAYARVMLRRAVACAARVIVGSESTRSELLAFDPAAATKTTLIPYGLDEKFRQPVPPAEAVRVRERFALRSPFLLFLGNDKPHKNLEGLLAAFASHRERDAGTTHHLVLAGGAEERRGDRLARIEAHRLEGLVHDLGVVPSGDIVPLVSEASALVLPSFSEGFGLPVLEAQSLGTPVLCSDRGGLKEAAGDAALVIDPEHLADLAAGITRILTDAPLREELSRKGRLHASAYGWGAAAERTAAVYRDLLERRS